MATRTRSAKTGRFVPNGTAKRSPGTTLVERVSVRKGTVTVKAARSAITGRFLNNAAAARHPNSTVVETITRSK